MSRKLGRKPKFKLVVMGDQYCGKSSIIHRYIYGEFNPTYTKTHTGDYYKKEVCVAGQKYDIQIFDTAGQESLRTVIKSLYRNANGILLVFDFSRRRTLEHIDGWIDLIKTNCDYPPDIFLVGNKSDLSRKDVQLGLGKEKACKYNIDFLEVSAKKNIQIEDAFQLLTEKCISSKGLLHADKNGVSESIVLTSLPGKESSTCCWS